MPPWAAPECDRVGNTFVSTQQLPAACASSAARIPASPAPMITVS